MAVIAEPCRMEADSAAMRTFDASLSAGSFWAVVLVPPIMFFLVVQVVDNAVIRGELGMGGVVLLIALAQLLPLGALVWILFGAAAYTITPGKLIVHRVMFDREYPLKNHGEPPRLQRNVIILHVPPRLRIRVEQPQKCLDVLRDALDASAGRCRERTARIWSGI